MNWPLCSEYILLEGNTTAIPTTPKAWREHDKQRYNKNKALLTQHINNILKNIHGSAVNQNFGILTGFDKHAIYVDISRQRNYPDCFVVRIANLGVGADKYHQSATQAEYYYPVGLIVSASITQQENLKKYLTELIQARYRTAKHALPLIYEVEERYPGLVLNKLTTSELAKQWLPSHKRIVGNCVTENHDHAMLQRWLDNSSSDFANVPAIMQLFGQKEIQCIPFDPKPSCELLRPFRA